MPDDFQFELGQEVKDKITGFIGVVTGRCQFLTGCNRYDVRSRKLDKDGIPMKDQWFDEHQMEATKGKKVSIDEPTKSEKKKGGPALPGQIPTSKDPN